MPQTSWRAKPECPHAHVSRLAIKSPSFASSGAQPLPLAAQLEAFVLEDSFPCVGARSAVNAGRAYMGRFGHLGCDDFQPLQSLCDALAAFSADYPDPGEAPVTFIALFEDDVVDELDFERRLWHHLQGMHGCDRLDFEWAPGVSSDPQSPDFSFSIAGRAFFVVGLHPRASRLARRAPMPCIAFNFHSQFEQLRASGKFEKMQRVIRARDIALQGHTNPVLSPYGEASEARQYSGRDMAVAWACPFRPGVQHGR